MSTFVFSVDLVFSASIVDLRVSSAAPLDAGEGGGNSQGRARSIVHEGHTRRTMNCHLRLEGQLSLHHSLCTTTIKKPMSAGARQRTLFRPHTPFRVLRAVATSPCAQMLGWERLDNFLKKLPLHTTKRGTISKEIVVASVYKRLTSTFCRAHPAHIYSTPRTSFFVTIRHTVRGRFFNLSTHSYRSIESVEPATPSQPRPQ
jgi:hypothetical protein